MPLVQNKILSSWRTHVYLGVTLAAFLHSVLQFAFVYSRETVGDLWMFPMHVWLGVCVGSIFLIPAYSVQTLLFWVLQKLKMGILVQTLSGGLLQALFVLIWDHYEGIQPSLLGNFHLAKPMIAAGFVAGAIVAFVASKTAELEG